MTPEEMVKELTEYFSGNYGPVLLRRLTETCANVPQEERQHVVQVIEEDNAPNFKCGVKAIADVCRKLSIPFHRVEDFYVPSEDWKCDGCGLQFKYIIAASYEDKHDRGLFDYCPRCGLPPYDTIQAEIIQKKHRGVMPALYETLKEQYLDSYRKRGSWMFDKRKDDKYVEDQQKEKTDAMKQDAHDTVEKARAARAV